MSLERVESARQVPEVLRALYVPNRVLVVGTWSLDLERLLKVPASTQIHIADPDFERVAQFKSALSNLPQITIEHAPILDGTENATYYSASLASESGFVEPELLRGMWRRIETRATRKVDTITLDDYVKAQNLEFDWIILNSLKHTKILEHAESASETANIIVTRDLDTSQLATENYSAAWLDAASETLLDQREFRRVARIPERNPRFGKSVWVRNWEQFARRSLAKADEKLRIAETELEKAQARAQALSVEKEQLFEREKQFVQDAQNQLLQIELSDQRAQTVNAKNEALKEQCSTLSRTISEQATHIERLMDEAQSRSEILVSEQALSERVTQLESENTSLSARVDQATQSALLSDSNLENMRLRFRRLATRHRILLERLESIWAHANAAEGKLAPLDRKQPAKGQKK
jgi:hypothetical protein